MSWLNTLSSLSEMGSALLETTGSSLKTLILQTSLEQYAREIAQQQQQQKSKQPTAISTTDSIDNLFTNTNVHAKPEPNGRVMFEPVELAASATGTPSLQKKQDLTTVEDLRRQVREYEQIISAKEEQIRRLTVAPDQNQVQVLQSKNQDLEKLLETLKVKAKTKIQELQSAVNGLSAENDNLRAKSAFNATPMNDVTPGDSRLLQLEQELVARDQRIQLQSDKMLQMESALQRTNLTLKERDTEIDKLKARVNQMNSAIQDRAEEVNAMEGLRQTIHLMKSELFRKESQMAEYESKLAEMTFQLQQKDKTPMEEEEGREQAIEQKNEEIRLIQQEYKKQLKILKDEHQNAIERLQLEHQQVTGQLSSTNNSSSENRESETMSYLQTQLAEKKESNEALEKELHSVQEEMSLQRQQNEKLNETLEQYKTRIQSSEEILLKRDEELKALKMQLQASSTNQMDLNRLRSNLEKAEKELKSQLASIDDYKKQVIEKDEMNKSLERQIAGLHKTTMALRVKDQEISKLQDSLSEKDDEIQELQRKLIATDEARAAFEDASKGMKLGLTDMQARFEVELCEKEKEFEKQREMMQELKKKADQVEIIATQSSAREIALQSKQSEVDQLKVELATLQENLMTFHDNSTALGVLEAQNKELESRCEAISLQNEDLNSNVESLRAELKEAQSANQNHSLLVDKLKEEHASMIAQLEREISDGKTIQFKSTQLLRDLEEEARQLKSDGNRKRVELEATVAKLDAAEKAYSVSKASLESRIAELLADKSSIQSKLQSMQTDVRTKQHQLEELQKQLEVKSSSSATDDSEKLLVEWKQKIRLLEQENIRLRDRTIRAERMMDDLQKQHHGTSEIGSLKRSDSAMLSHVTTLPWLQTKEEDDPENGTDLEAPLGGNQAMRPGGGGVLKIKYLAQRKTRQILRALDMQSVRWGYYLREKPVARMAVVAYVILFHILFIWILF